MATADRRLRAAADHPVLTLERPTLVEGERHGRRGDIPAFLAVSARHTDRGFLTLVQEHGTGVVWVTVSRERRARLARGAGTALAETRLMPLIAVALRGAERPGHADDVLAAIHALADPSVPENAFAMPGHVWPADLQELERRGVRFPLLQLWVAAGPPSAAPPVVAFAELDRGLDSEHGWAERARALGVAHAVPERHLHARAAGLPELELAVTTTLPTDRGSFLVHGVLAAGSGRELVALTRGDPAALQTPVYVHARCLPGDTFRAASCDCGRALQHALDRINGAGRGIVVTYDARAGAVCPADSTDSVAAHEAAALLQHLGCYEPELSSNRPQTAETVAAALRAGAARTEVGGLFG